MRNLFMAVAILIAAASQGIAQERPAMNLRLDTRQSDIRILHLPAEIPTDRGPSIESPVNLRPFQPDVQPPTVMHVGPINAEMIDGHAHYSLDGVHVLGGGVSGSVGGGGAKIFLHWTNN